MLMCATSSLMPAMPAMELAFAEKRTRSLLAALPPRVGPRIKRALFAWLHLTVDAVPSGALVQSECYKQWWYNFQVPLLLQSHAVVHISVPRHATAHDLCHPASIRTNHECR
jgi:hypothetical protein